jgi:adenylate cyclase
VEDPSLKRAEALYDEPLNPDRTREIEQLLGQEPTEGPAAAKRKALEAVVALCEYLNRWNGVGKMNVEAAKRAIRQALEIDAELAAPYYAQGFVFRTEGEHQKALESFQRAVAIEPNNARAIAQAGAEELYLGHPHRALAAIRKAIEVSPDSPARGMFCWIGARAHFFDGNYREALPWLRQSIETWPDLWYTRSYEVSALAHIGDLEQARAKLAEFVQRFPDLTTIARIVDAEKTNPNKNPFVVEGRRQFHAGLAKAGMPPGHPGQDYPRSEPPAAG